MKRLAFICTLLLFCCASAIPVMSQSAASATVLGQVVDPQGAVVPDAKGT